MPLQRSCKHLESLAVLQRYRILRVTFRLAPSTRGFTVIIVVVVIVVDTYLLSVLQAALAAIVIVAL